MSKNEPTATHGTADPTVSRRKPYNNRPGYVASKRAGLNGGWVVIYDTRVADIDTGGVRYAVACETHGLHVSARSDPEARYFMKHPSEWCAGCEGRA